MSNINKITESVAKTVNNLVFATFCQFYRQQLSKTSKNLQILVQTIRFEFVKNGHSWSSPIIHDYTSAL